MFVDTAKIYIKAGFTEKDMLRQAASMAVTAAEAEM